MTTDEGWLRVDAVIGRGDVVLPYRRADGSVRWELRLAADVTDAASLDSFEALPVTNEHPPVHLDASNVKTYKVGQCGTPRVDGPLVRAKVLVDDRGTIADIRAGKRQISPGYRVVLDETPGVFRGQRYDAVQKNIRGNHVAIVPLGRQGPEVALRMDGADAVLAFDLLEIHDMADPTKTDPKDPKNDGAPKTEIKVDTDALVTALASKLDSIVAEKIDAAIKPIAAKVDEMGAAMLEMGKKPEEDLPKTDASDPKSDDGPRMDAATRARIDSLEAQVKSDAAERKAMSEKHRADMAESELRADVLATAKRVIGDDYSGAGKGRLDIMGDVIVKVDGDESKATIASERGNVRSDAPGSEQEFHGYMRARYADSLKRWGEKQDASEDLLKAAKTVKNEDSDDDREDAASKAKAESEARKRDRWKK